MASGNINPSTAASVAVAAASAQLGGTFQEGQMVSIVSTTAAWVTFAAAPVAVARSAANAYIPPNYPMVFIVPPGASKVAIIQDAAGGWASIGVVVG